MASSTEGNDGKQSEPEAHEQQNQMESTESSNQQGQQNDMQTATIASSEGHNEHEESSNLNQVDDSQAQQGEEDGDQLDQESDQRSLRKEKKQQRPDKRCRFYEKRFPKLEEVVMVVVKNIAEMGAYVDLLEYDGVEGMILLSELSRRRIRSINKLVRVGKTEAVVVLRVDESRGYIDLSKRRVSPEEVAACEARYNQAKIDLEELHKRTAWKLERQTGPGTAYAIFKKAIIETPEMFDEFDIPDNVKTKLRQKVAHKLMPNTVKVRAEIEAKCFAYDGINAIKSALRAGLEESTEDYAIQINLIAPPAYKLETIALDRQVGIEVLERCIDRIRKELEDRHGELEVKLEPSAVSDEDEKRFKKRMEEIERDDESFDSEDDDE
eukprot:gene5893-9079_t